MDDNLLHNRTFDQLAIGESASLVRTAARTTYNCSPRCRGTSIPRTFDAAFAVNDMFGHVVVARHVGQQDLSLRCWARGLPGPGTIYLDQDLQFRYPVVPGDVVSATVTVKEKRADKRIVLLDTRCTNQRGETVLTGMAR